MYHGARRCAPLCRDRVGMDRSLPTGGSNIDSMGGLEKSFHLLSLATATTYYFRAAACSIQKFFIVFFRDTAGDPQPGSPDVFAGAAQAEPRARARIDRLRDGRPHTAEQGDCISLNIGTYALT